jgi:hypothetical protein
MAHFMQIDFSNTCDKEFPDDPSTYNLHPPFGGDLLHGFSFEGGRDGIGFQPECPYDRIGRDLCCYPHRLSLEEGSLDAPNP